MAAKFVIYGQSRSGSTLLVEMLNARPDVRCDGELLNRHGGYIGSSVALKIIRRYPLPYFNYRRRRAGARSYGFKLLFNHPRYPSAYARLAGAGWRFLHVRRRDVERQALSSLIAAKTGHYHRREGSASPAYRVTITDNEVDAELAKRELWTATELSLIDGIEHLDIVYEDDLLHRSSWATTMTKVFGYLDMVPTGVVEPSLQSTDPRPYHEVIENYEKLLAHLSESRHESARFTVCRQSR